MNDSKNILLAWLSSVSPIFLAIETQTWITVVTAIILPIIFFAAGKTIDVFLQIHLKRKAARSEEKET